MSSLSRTDADTAGELMETVAEEAEGDEGNAGREGADAGEDKGDVIIEMDDMNGSASACGNDGGDAGGGSGDARRAAKDVIDISINEASPVDNEDAYGVASPLATRFNHLLPLSELSASPSSTAERPSPRTRPKPTPPSVSANNPKEFLNMIKGKYSSEINDIMAKTDWATAGAPDTSPGGGVASSSAAIPPSLDARARSLSVQGSHMSLPRAISLSTSLQDQSVANFRIPSFHTPKEEHTFESFPRKIIPDTDGDVPEEGRIRFNSYRSDSLQLPDGGRPRLESHKEHFQAPRRSLDYGMVGHSANENNGKRRFSFDQRPKLSFTETVSGWASIASDLEARINRPEFQATLRSRAARLAEIKKETPAEAITKRDRIIGGFILLASIGVLVLLLTWVVNLHPHPERGIMHWVTRDRPFVYHLHGDGHEFAEVVVGLQGTVDKQVLSILPQAVLHDHNESWTDTAPAVQVASSDIFKYKRLEVLFRALDHVDLRLYFTTNSTDPFLFELRVLEFTSGGNYQVLLGGLLLIAVYVCIAFELVHRTLAAIIGSFGCMLLLAIFGKLPTLAVAMSWIDVGTLGLLFGMMVLVEVLAMTGVFEYSAVLAYRISGGHLMRLVLLLSVVTMFLSAFLDNVTTILLLAPVTVRLCKLMDIKPQPLVITEALFSNIGGTMTMIGDPPNIIIGNLLHEHLGFVDFIVNLAPAVLFSAVPALFFVCKIYYSKEFAQEGKKLDVKELQKEYTITNEPLLLKSGIVLSFVILVFFLHPAHHVNPAWIALFGCSACLVLLSHHQLRHIFQNVEWDTLLFFAGLFTLIEGLSELGLISFIAEGVASAVASVDKDVRLAVAMIIIVWVSGIASAFIDNIPYTATMVPVIVRLAEDPDVNLPLKPLAWALSLGACMGGNGTMVGASANLVAAGICEQNGEPFTFKEFFKVGFSTMLISLTVCMAYLIVVYHVMGFR